MSIQAGLVRVVVLNYHEDGVTTKCVQRVVAQKYSPIDTVVVDVDRSEEAAATLRSHLPEGVRVLACPENPGYAAGNNIGIRASVCSEPEYVMIVNNDAFLDSDATVQALIDSLDSYPQVAAVSPLVDTVMTHMSVERQLQVMRLAGFWSTVVSGSGWLRRFPVFASVYRRHIYFDQMPWRRMVRYETDTINGSCFMIRMQALQDIGLLDEGTFLYGEEAILGWQLRSIGWRCMLDTHVAVRHLQGMSTGQRGRHTSPERYWQRVRSETYYCATYLKTGVAGIVLLRVVRYMDLVGKRLLELARSLPRQKVASG
jgi:GT2 family glycosyltransferase